MRSAKPINAVPEGPTVWALIGPKHGDNAQVRALADALARTLGARSAEYAFRYHRAELLIHLWPGPTLAGVAPGGRPSLGPPWPDLVIGAGRRSEPVARWIRRASGGRARLVHLGRPWSAPDQFDLVVASSQYAIPAGEHVLEFALPLTGAPLTGGAALTGAPLTGAPLTESSRSTGSSAPSGVDLPFAHLPRPWTGVLIGGDSGFLLFDRERARQLAAQLRASRAITGGSLIITGSPRTPARFCAALGAALDAPVFLHRWSAGAPNPYAAILATADTLVVTSDSISMVVEALATGKPVYLYDVRPRGSGWWQHLGEYRWRALSHRLVQAAAPLRFRRDVRRVHAHLVDTGAVRWLQDAATPFVPTPFAVADLAQVVERIRRLLAARGPER